jgi:hypothetical protein
MMRLCLCTLITSFAFLASPAGFLPQGQDKNTSHQSLYELESHAAQAYSKKEYAKATGLFKTAFAGGLSRYDDFYTAACASALVGDKQKALQYLGKAAQLGFRDSDQVETDTDLAAVRSDPAFKIILDKVRSNARSYALRHHDPEAAAIVTSDIDLFWHAYDKLQTSPKPELLLEDEYLLRGSPGLQDFVFARIQSAAELLKTIKAAPKYYAALRPATLQIKTMPSGIRSSFRKLAELYPESIFPDIYFLIGRMNSGGTTGPSGLLIGADMFGKGPGVPMSELSEWHQTVVQSVSDIPGTVAHELIHYQQSAGGKTLLAAAIQEGSADFIGELISGEAMNLTGRRYGLQHEKELWTQFAREMHGTEEKTVNGRPADLAYFVGYRISEAYYNRAADKKRAIAEILRARDVDQILKESGYPERFKAKN